MTFVSTICLTCNPSTTQIIHILLVTKFKLFFTLDRHCLIQFFKPNRIRFLSFCLFFKILKSKVDDVPLSIFIKKIFLMTLGFNTPPPPPSHSCHLIVPL